MNGSIYHATKIQFLFFSPTPEVCIFLNFHSQASLISIEPICIYLRFAELPSLNEHIRTLSHSWNFTLPQYQALTLELASTDGSGGKDASSPECCHFYCDCKNAGIWYRKRNTLLCIASWCLNKMRNEIGMIGTKTLKLGSRT